MPDITFVNGIRASRRDNAPEWALLKQTIDRDKFIAWLQEQPEDVIHIETLRSKSTGKLYAKLDEDEREFQARIRKEELGKAKAAVTEAQEIPEDDIPF